MEKSLILNQIPFLIRTCVFENYSDLQNRLYLILKPFENDLPEEPKKLILDNPKTRLSFHFNKDTQKIELDSNSYGNKIYPKDFLYKNNYENILYIARDYENKDREYFSPNELESITKDFFSDGSQFASLGGHLTLWEGII